jgi:hypothetical protein
MVRPARGRRAGVMGASSRMAGRGWARSVLALWLLAGWGWRGGVDGGDCFYRDGKAALGGSWVAGQKGRWGEGVWYFDSGGLLTQWAKRDVVVKS